MGTGTVPYLVIVAEHLLTPTNRMWNLLAGVLLGGDLYVLEDCQRLEGPG
jgi:hypothetical protein